MFFDQIDVFVDIGGVIILAWALLPAAIYCDLLYVRDVSEWQPNRLLWPVLAAVWIINIPAGLIYLHKRVRALGPFWKRGHE